MQFPSGSSSNSQVPWEIKILPHSVHPSPSCIRGCIQPQWGTKWLPLCPFMSRNHAVEIVSSFTDTRNIVDKDENGEALHKPSLIQSKSTWRKSPWFDLSEKATWSSEIFIKNRCGSIVKSRRQSLSHANSRSVYPKWFSSWRPGALFMNCYGPMFSQVPQQNLHEYSSRSVFFTGSCI